MLFSHSWTLFALSGRIKVIFLVMSLGTIGLLSSSISSFFLGEGCPQRALVPLYSLIPWVSPCRHPRKDSSALPWTGWACLPNFGVKYLQASWAKRPKAYLASNSYTAVTALHLHYCLFLNLFRTLARKECCVCSVHQCTSKTRDLSFSPYFVIS